MARWNVQREKDLSDQSVVVGNTLVLSDPQVITWRDKEAYVYSVDSRNVYSAGSRNGRGPRSDLEFVIYIPIDTAVQWLDGNGWEKKGKGERPGNDEEEDTKEKSDGAKKKSSDDKDYELDNTESDSRFSIDSILKSQTKNYSTDSSDEECDRDRSKANIHKKDPNRNQEKDESRERKDEKDDKDKAKRTLREGGRKKKIKQESDTEDKERKGRKGGRIKKKPERDWDAWYSNERFSDSSWGPYETYLGSRKEEKNPVTMKPHDVDFQHRVRNSW